MHAKMQKPIDRMAQGPNKSTTPVPSPHPHSQSFQCLQAPNYPIPFFPGCQVSTDGGGRTAAWARGDSGGSGDCLTCEASTRALGSGEVVAGRQHALCSSGAGTSMHAVGQRLRRRVMAAPAVWARRSPQDGREVAACGAAAQAHSRDISARKHQRGWRGTRLRQQAGEW